MTVSTSDSAVDAESMCILAVASYCPAEVVNSVCEMDAEVEMLVLNENAGLLSRAQEAVR